MAGKYIVVDGSSLIHRAFYALPPLTTSGGLHTHAVFGFVNMLGKLIADFQPAGMIVAFDKSRLTFRNEQYAEYKAQRKPTPSELSEQFPAAREVLSALGITSLELEGYEADDIIGTLACRFADNHELLIVTGDRDLLQLVRPQVHVLLTRKGITDFEEVDPVSLTFNHGLSAEQVVELKGLMGDSSDNIPGVPGVGEKTARKLIQEFGSIDQVYASIDKISGEKLKEKLLTHREMAYLSKKLATIECNVPLATDWEQYKIKPDMEKIRVVAEKYEFRGLPSKVSSWLAYQPSAAGDEQAEPANQNCCQFELVLSQQQAVAVAEKIRQQEGLFFVANPTGELPEIYFDRAAVYIGDTAYGIATDSPAWPLFISWLADPTLNKVTHDAKPIYNACRLAGLDFAGFGFDTMLAAYLLRPGMNGYSLSRLAEIFLGISSSSNDESKDLAGTDWQQLGQAARMVADLYGVLSQELERIGARELFQTIEMPLTEVLSQMEIIGIQLDRSALETMDRQLTERIETLLKSIHQAAGETFNVNSTKQLGTVLFEKLKLPVGKKTKTGYSTDVEVLENLSGTHQIIDSLLEYRTLTKLKSTYLDGLRPLIRAGSGRVHTHFNQTVTATGRLSSSNPNLQNIPVRTEVGRQIRQWFVPGQGFDLLVAADYSQIELRILAHLAGDENMLRSFRAGEDIHTRTAAEVFDVPIDEVSAEQRSRAKAVNFGIVYGISDYGLSQDIGVSRKEAAEYIAGYFARYPAVRAFIDTTIMEARMNGYVSTLFGRRRYLPDINSSNFNLRSFAERTAMNTPVQGTAADIIKKAMITVAAELKKRRLKSRMLLQVHDELVLECKKSELEEVSMLLRQAMEQAADLAVPLCVDVKWGLNWAQTK